MTVETQSKFERSTILPFNGGTRAKAVSKGFSGKVICPDIHEIIKSVCLSKLDIALMIKNGRKDGKIIFKGGGIMASICGDLRGREALLEIISWEKGYFTFYRIFDGILCHNE